MFKKIYGSFSNKTSQLKIDNKNSGDDISMPEFSIKFLNDIIDKNDLIPTGLRNNIEYFKSNKYSETILTFNPETFEIRFKGRLFVSTYFRVSLPKGFDFDIRNRSSNFKNNINVICGLIDNPYTGEMGLQIHTISPILTILKCSTSSECVRYAQIKINKYHKRKWKIKSLNDFLKLGIIHRKNKIRGQKGFGSTNKNN